MILFIDQSHQNYGRLLYKVEIEINEKEKDF